MSNIKAVWAVNSSVAMGLAALARPPYDLLTVCFIKYNTGLDCVCVRVLVIQPPVASAEASLPV